MGSNRRLGDDGREQQGPQDLLSDPHMCSSSGDKPALALGLFTISSACCPKARAPGSSAATEQRFPQKPSSPLRGLGLTEPRWRDVWEAWRRARAKYYSNRLCSGAAASTCWPAPAAGFPKALPPTEPVGQVLRGRLGDTGPEGPRGPQKGLWAVRRSK